MVSFPLTPRVDLHLGTRTQRAHPVSLRGDRASFLLASDPPDAGQEVRLTLRWWDGGVTELGARVEDVGADPCVAHVEVRRVEGDWQPFLHYLGRLAA